jgi:hypothetical protein
VASDTPSSAIKIALIGWRDALRAITQMMPVAGPAFLFALMCQTAFELLRGHSLAIDVLIFPVYRIAQCLVLTPLAIAVHRYVLLDEVTQHYALNPADQRFQRFFGFAVAVQALWFSIGIWLIIGHFAFGMPMFRGEPLTPEARENLVWILLVFFAALITGFVIARMILSIAILFPAVATDAPGAGWRNARDDSEEHVFRIFCAFALGLAPLFPLDAVDELILASREVGSHPAFQAIGVVLQAAELVLIVSAFAAIASTFYVAFGGRLKGSATVWSKAG